MRPAEGQHQGQGSADTLCQQSGALNSLLLLSSHQTAFAQLSSLFCAMGAAREDRYQIALHVQCSRPDGQSLGPGAVDQAVEDDRSSGGIWQLPHEVAVVARPAHPAALVSFLGGVLSLSELIIKGMCSNFSFVHARRYVHSHSDARHTSCTVLSSEWHHNLQQVQTKPASLAAPAEHAMSSSSNERKTSCSLGVLCDQTEPRQEQNRVSANPGISNSAPAGRRIVTSNLCVPFHQG